MHVLVTHILLPPVLPALPPSFSHRGGLLLQGKQQFNPSHFTPHHKGGKKGEHRRHLLRGTELEEEEEEEVNLSE
jgi:hypothetical protein